MIITQTPLRISFAGGGTDFREYFLQEEGWVVSSAIDKYIFVIIKERFDDKIRVGYTKTELVNSVDELEHDLVRECLRKTGITKRVEITTMGDIPSSGSGLGSSSTVTVGLLNAMFAYQGETKDAECLARLACEIEIDVLGKPIGVQDQYIAAFGGQRFLYFGRDNQIRVDPIGMEKEQIRYLNRNLMLFYTGVTRKSETILTEQVCNMAQKTETLQELKQIALQAREYLRAGELDRFGCCLDEGWQTKKRLASQISNSDLDDLYHTARNAGALGGKIAGAGGGGFLMLYCPHDRQGNVRSALRSLTELPFHLERDGSKVVFNARR